MTQTASPNVGQSTTAPKSASSPAAQAGKPKAPAPVQTPEDELEAGTMTFWEHLDELRRRLIWSLIAFVVCCLVAWEFKEQILAVLTKPFVDSWIAQKIPGQPTLHFAAPGAAFVAYFKLSMIGGVALAAPFIFYQVWAFVAPGLYAREKKFVIPFVLFSTLLFVGGGFFGWRTAFPITFNYFLSMSGTVAEGGITITPTVMMAEYLDFVSQMLLAFGIIFEIPLLILFLSVAGIVNYLQLYRFGRWFVLGAFVVAAIITPPDATSQLVMAVPMCLLYFFSIALAYLFGKPPTEAQREAYRLAKEKKKQQTE